MGEKSHYGKRLWGEDVRVWKMEIMELCLAFSELFSMWSIGVDIGFLPTASMYGRICSDMKTHKFKPFKPLM